VTESIYASLVVIPTDVYYAQSTATGIIETINVEIGDLVKKGDVLFTIKAANSENRVNDAQLALESAKENYSGENNLLKNIEVEIANSEEQLKQDSLNFLRLKKLWEQRIGAKVDLERAELKYQSSANNVVLLKKKYKQSSQDLKSTYKRSLNKLDNEKIQLSDFTLYSLLDGKVYGLFKEVGELITPQDRIAEIGNMDSFKLEMALDEIDITKVNVGDTAVISLDAYPNEVFTAVVSKILPKKDAQNLAYSVEGLFINSPDKLLYGLSGEANIIVERRNKVLTIPAGYLNSNNEVETEGGVIKVVTGIKNLDFVEIVSGLDTTSILVEPSQ
jgi:multidrug resistance efflux pump